MNIDILLFDQNAFPTISKRKIKQLNFGKAGQWTRQKSNCLIIHDMITSFSSYIERLILHYYITLFSSWKSCSSLSFKTTKNRILLPHFEGKIARQSIFLRYSTPNQEFPHLLNKYVSHRSINTVELKALTNAFLSLNDAYIQLFNNNI